MNTEKLRQDASNNGFGGAIDASAAIARGNVESIDLKLLSHLQHQTFYHNETTTNDPQDWIKRQLLLAVNLQYASASDAAYVNETFAHLRWTQMWKKYLGTEVFTQYQSNEFYRLKLRALAGAGVRIVILNHATFRVFAGIGAMAEYESLDLSNTIFDDTKTWLARSTNYLTIDFNIIDERFALMNTVYVQPRITDANDIRVLNELEAKLTINSYAAFVTSMQYFYDSRPPIDIDSSNLKLTNALRIKF